MRARRKLGEVPAMILACLAAVAMVMYNYSLASQLSFGLTAMMILQLPLAFILTLVLLLRRGKARPLIPLILACTSSLFYQGQYPQYVNRVVERVGPDRILAAAEEMCREYRAIKDWKDRDRFNNIHVSDPGMPEALRELKPLYATVKEDSVSLKMGGMMDEYSGFRIRPAQRTPGGRVDWTQTDTLRRSEEGGLKWTHRTIAPGIEWETWSAP